LPKGVDVFEWSHNIIFTDVPALADESPALLLNGSHGGTEQPAELLHLLEEWQVDLDGVEAEHPESLVVTGRPGVTALLVCVQEPVLQPDLEDFLQLQVDVELQLHVARVVGGPEDEGVGLTQLTPEVTQHVVQRAHLAEHT